MKSSKSLSGLNQKYRGKPKKYAEGGEVMSNEDYDSRLLSRMKAQMGRASEPTRAEQMQALRTAGRSAAEGLADVLLPQSPLDVALMVALGPGGRAARLAGSAALASLEPSEAEASRLRRLILAYHGSPHKFDEFDIRKIGTGEGAQAYGRGLYFAENEDVARDYRNKLSKSTIETASGRLHPYSSSAADEIAGDLMVGANPQVRYPAEDAIGSMVRGQSLDTAIAQMRRNYDHLDPANLDEAERLLRQNNPRVISSGHMYEVNLNAAPRDFLNWDAPLSQQSREVQDSLQRFGLRADPDAARAYDDALLDALYNDPGRALPPQPRDPTGQEIYQRHLRMTPEEARVALMEVGVPGTRYLDAGSRGVGGTYNYAVFDPEIIDITRRYAEGGLAALDEKYAEGGTVRAPKETTIAGQDHKLAYITDREAALLKARGGSGRMTEHGVRAYDEGPGGEGPGGQGPGGDPSDNANSMSESATQDAVGGNQGQGAGPTGAGAGSGPPGGPDSNPNEDASTETSVTAPTTAPTTGAFGQFGAATGLGVVGGLASFGIGVPGLGTAAAGFGAALDAAKANEQLGMMGLNQTVDRDSAVANAVSMGAFGQSVANQFGQALGFDALAEAPMSAFSTPDPLGDIAASQMDSGGSQYEQTEYGTPGLSNIATSMAPATAASLIDWNQIQREASAMNMSVSDYLAMKWRSPAAMARGGMASLQQMHAKYAEGGPVVSVYDPDEINDLANQILEGAYV